MLHEKVILLTIVTEGVPEVAKRDRVEVRELRHGFSEVIAHYGFMADAERAAGAAARQPSRAGVSIPTR